jgi:hypothetical protein
MGDPYGPNMQATLSKIQSQSGDGSHQIGKRSIVPCVLLLSDL